MESKIIKEAASCYGAEPIKCLGGFLNQVYLLRQGQRELVLKAYKADQVTYRQLKSEYLWMQALREDGVEVPQHILTEKGSPILELNDEDTVYYFTVFSKVEGVIVPPQEWNKQFYYLWGQSLGRMHAVASTFIEPDEEFELPHWSTTPEFDYVHENDGQPMVNIFQEMINYSASLPISKKTFGITHNDFHHENFFVQDQQIIPIDFGDMQYSHYFYDMAVTIYHAIQVMKKRANTLDFLHEFLPHFFSGYESVHVSLDEFGDWMVQLPRFLSYRRMYSYVHMQLYLPTEKKISLQPMLEEMRKNIINQTPVVEFPEGFFKELRN